MMRKELLGRMFRTAAMIMIISMLAGACSKNNGPEKPEDNTGQTTGPGGNGSGDQGNSGNEGGSGDEGGNEGGTSGGDHGGSGDSGSGGSGGSGDQGDQPKPQITANSWMTAIDDDTKIAMLTIPGTHDAATSTCAGPGKCQTLTISGQLEHGVRAFDLRPTMDNNSTLGNIYHSILDTGVSMGNAMEYFDSFLKAHPGEGIIVIMRYESERQIFGSIAEDNYKTAMKNFLWDSQIYQARMAAFNKSMTMKDLRGKILIISRNDLSPVSTFETAYTQWSHSNSVGEALQIYGTGGLGRIYV